MVDLALARVRRVTDEIAVNVHHHRDMLEPYLFGGVHVSIEHERPLGTAGALGQLRDWLDGRDVLVVNVDAWHEADLAAFATGWDGERIRLVVAGEAEGGLVPGTRIVASFMPWRDVRELRPEPSGLYEVSWRQAASEGRVELVGYGGRFVDCGTPTDYLRANMLASGGAPVVGRGAQIAGRLVRSVVWPGGYVRAGEELVDAIRVGDRLTVLCR